MEEPMSASPIGAPAPQPHETRQAPPAKTERSAPAKSEHHAPAHPAAKPSHKIDIKV
jgi:hypothetical protein